MTYEVSRDGRNLGTYTDEGLTRQLVNGALLPTDLVFLETEQRWVPISELPKTDAEEVHEFTQKVETATPRAFITPALVACNAAVFLVMIIAGVSIVDPRPADLVRWGADYGPLVVIQGQWWRLLTSAFVHVGILHIGLNMLVLSSGGIVTERLFGNLGFLTLYLLSAIGGSLASLAWHPFTVAAGASGAIFGVYAARIGLLMVQDKSIPRAASDSLAKSALGFVGYNILFAAIGNLHIDMAAHLGGLVTGLLAGCALAYRSGPAAGVVTLHRSISVALIGLTLFVPIGLKLRSGNTKQGDAYAAEITGTSLTIGKNDRLVYSGRATREDAMRLAEMLTRIGFMADRGVLVLYTKDQPESVVSMIVKDEAWQNQKLASGFRFIGTMIASVTGTPLKLQLLNTKREVKKEFVYGPRNEGVQEQ